MRCEDECPKCESTNTQSTDWDADVYGRRLQYMHCCDCGCDSVVKWEEVIDDIEILNEEEDEEDA